MSTFNRILIYGIMGQSPELKTTQKGKPYCRLAVATHYKKKGESESTTTWHSVHFFGAQAETAVRYLRSGASVFIEGRVEQSARTGLDGRLEYTMWTIGQCWHFVGKRELPNDPDGDNTEDAAVDNADLGDVAA